MDVIEDFTNLLIIVLDYLGVNLTQLIENIQFPVWRLQHVCHQGLTRRSLVRQLSALFPRRPARRIRLQSHLLGNHYHYRRDSLESTSLSTASSNSFDNLLWVEEDLGNNCFHIRADNHTSSDQPDFGDDFEDGTFTIRKNEMTSTPLNMSLSMCSTVSNDPLTALKITAMEEELANLRKQIALLVLAQETANKSVRAEPDVSSTTTPVLSLAQAPGIPPPPPPPPPPPLPPPPPPPLPPPMVSVKIFQGGKTLADMLKQGKDGLMAAQHADQTDSTKHGGVPNMTLVLKDLKKVKLRSVKRSPGGTPFRDEATYRDQTDPASIIAQALKKKFAHRKLFSPEHDKENNHSFSSPEKSPCLPFGQHILRKTKKRSSLLKDNTQKADKSPLKVWNS